MMENIANIYDHAVNLSAEELREFFVDLEEFLYDNGLRKAAREVRRAAHLFESALDEQVDIAKREDMIMDVLTQAQDQLYSEDED